MARSDPPKKQKFFKMLTKRSEEAEKHLETLVEIERLGHLTPLKINPKTATKLIREDKETR